MKYPESAICGFWKRVDRRGPDECWPWLGHTEKRKDANYGRYSYGLAKQVRTHRLSWEINRGPIPDGLHVLHKCDNPPCCNPGHLFLGTQTDNNRDKVSKKRHRWGAPRRGAENKSARLSTEQVKEIKACVAAGVTQRELAFVFKISQATVWNIANGRTWSHIP